MITIAVCGREYPINISDNVFGDDCALVCLSVRTHHPRNRKIMVDARTWMLISSVGKPPKILTEEEALQARANTFYSDEGFCRTVIDSHPV